MNTLTSTLIMKVAKIINTQALKTETDTENENDIIDLNFFFSLLKNINMSDQNKVVKISTASKKLDGNNNWNSSNFENDGREDSILCKDEKYLNF